MSHPASVFQRGARAWIRLALAGLTGLLILPLALNGILPATLIARKLAGHSPYCSWSSVLAAPGQRQMVEERMEALRARIAVCGRDPAGIYELCTPERAFWVKQQGSAMDGRTLLAELLTDHAWLAETGGRSHVRPGDIVLDCGAHVGAFTHTALRRGASKVVAIEVDPVNIECLRRNFRREIDAGQVVVYDQGVWHSAGKLTLSLGGGNSGENSVVFKRTDQQIEVSVTTIDRMVAELGLERVDFIKMDIEGAEREALRGARQTLQRFKPRLFLDSYHRPDDMEVLPQVIAEARSDYSMRCGPCEISGRPHVTFFE